ncbi:DUF6380 family protein [Streptomyces sp. NPDC002888]|uniref:DUF6380 family protein n=1 Tax=Streptomyces sp. NPDC002888 TaxID=3364668 RepID=UPI0036994095
MEILGRGDSTDDMGRGDRTDDMRRGGRTGRIRHATLRRGAASLTATARRACSSQLGGAAGEGAR